MGKDGEFFEKAGRVVENDYTVGFVVPGSGDLNIANTMSAQPRQDMFLHLDFYIDRQNQQANLSPEQVKQVAVAVERIKEANKGNEEERS